MSKKGLYINEFNCIIELLTGVVGRTDEDDNIICEIIKEMRKIRIELIKEQAANIKNQEFKVSFNYISKICKYSELGYHDSIVERTCRHQDNKPKGHSWGNCLLEYCPKFKICLK